MVSGADGELEIARTALIDAAGIDAFVDAAGVTASFNSVVRIADATGIPLEESKRERSADVRAELGIDDWH